MDNGFLDQTFARDPNSIVSAGIISENHLHQNSSTAGQKYSSANTSQQFDISGANQKRSNSMSAYANNPASKRSHNPLQMQLPMQSNVPGAQNYSNATSAARSNAAPQRRVTKRNNQFASPIPLQGQDSMKTPTPSNYEVPSSPNTTRVFVQNNSDSSASSPVVDASNANLAQSTNESMSLQSQVGQPANQTNNSQRLMTDEEQQLANKLKETYKNIVNFEEVVQKSCIDLTMKINQFNLANQNSSIHNSMYDSPIPESTLHPNNASNTTELSNDLWTIYHHNITLLNNYHDFLITALKPTANTTQFKTGRNIVDLYKIPRRMWVYGIVGFLEVLKNIMSIFSDHEIFSCFIAYCFSVVSNLTDPALEMEGWWCEKLGDLSRMAIALYSSRFIDWKISSEYWYSVSMKTMYGHGKIYYHICTVEQDNLDALVNIGKAVSCRDPFVPTQQYLGLVVENICTQRNILSLLELPIIDFIKIHKVLLSVHNNHNKSSMNAETMSQVEIIHDAQLQYGIDLVTRYGLTFGCDSHGYNFFTRNFCITGGSQNRYGADPFNSYLKQQHEQEQQSNTLDTIEKMNFWFNKGSSFAIANINHLIGFGDSKNPFAKLFHLPEALKERKDKKDRKKRTKSQNFQDENGLTDMASVLSSNLGGVDSPLYLASELSVVDWLYCLRYINKSVLELSFRILNHYLIGPKQASTCHIIVWLYFLIAVGRAVKEYPSSRNMFLWLFRKFFPWESLISYLNTLVSVIANNSELNGIVCDYLLNKPNYMEHFNNSEFLPEVWKCWGTLWFDVICSKGDYNDPESAGISNYNLFDIPNCGTSPAINISSEQSHGRRKDDHEHDNDQRLVRIVLLARYLADNFDFGLIRTSSGFKFDEQTYIETENNQLISEAVPNKAGELFKFIRDVMFADGRLVQNHFVIPISPENLANADDYNMLTPKNKDEQWFNFNSSNDVLRNNDIDLGDCIVHDEELDGYADSESDDGNRDLEQAFPNQSNMTAVHSTEFGINPIEAANFDEFYNAINSQYLSQLGGSEFQVDGDLGDRMDSSLTYFSLDTNLWLKHCGRIFKCLRSKVIKVSIPLIVFQELRSLRKSAEATIADAATRSVIIIRELYHASEIVPLRFDGTVASDINETAEFENNSNWMSNVDSIMLNVVNEHDEISKKLLKGLNCTVHGPTPTVLDNKTAKMFRYCILITDDRNMRLRAKTAGLSSFQSKWFFGQLDMIASGKCID